MIINPLTAANTLAASFRNSALGAKPADSSSGSGSSGSGADSIANSASDMFLQLLVTQLKTQDPTSPMDPTEMVGQMLSMNQLNELIQIRQLLQGVSPTATGNSATGNSVQATQNK